MIDTWARHLAAIGEARRLIGLVLQNNAVFRAYQGRAGAGQPELPVPAELARDPQFTAYVHLTKAIEALQPIPTPGDVAVETRRALSKLVSEIKPSHKPPAGDLGQTQVVSPGPVAACDGADLARLKARLSYVLEEAPEAAVTAAAHWGATGGEAQVAIVRARDLPSPAPGVL